MCRGRYLFLAFLRALGILVICAAIAMITFTLMALGADSEPHMKTKLCAPDESRCTDVADFSGVNRARVEAYITNDVSVTPGAIGDRFFTYLLNGSSSDLRVDGSGTPVVFSAAIHATKKMYVEQLRCFGGCSGIKFEQHLCKNVVLTNGIQFEIKADNKYHALPTIKVTEDWKNSFSYASPNNFRIDIQSGGDQFLAVFQPTVPFPLFPTGSYSPDDYVKVTVADNLYPQTSGLSQLECAVVGFYR